MIYAISMNQKKMTTMTLEQMCRLTLMSTFNLGDHEYFIYNSHQTLSKPTHTCSENVKNLKRKAGESHCTLSKSLFLLSLVHCSEARQESFGNG